MLSLEQIADIPRMRNELKMTDNEIAEAYNCSRNTVAYWVRRLRDEGHDIKRYGRGGRPPLDISEVNK